MYWEGSCCESPLLQIQWQQFKMSNHQAIGNAQDEFVWIAIFGIFVVFGQLGDISGNHWGTVGVWIKWLANKCKPIFHRFNPTNPANTAAWANAKTHLTQIQAVAPLCDFIFTLYYIILYFIFGFTLHRISICFCRSVFCCIQDGGIWFRCLSGLNSKTMGGGFAVVCDMHPY